MKHRVFTSGAFAIALLLLTFTAAAQTTLETAAEHRLQLDFHVNDAALAKMLPAGWEALVATAGPAKDCNLRMIFIDRMGIIGRDGKPAARPTGPAAARPCWSSRATTSPFAT